MGSCHRRDAMTTRRAHVVIAQELVAEIDRIVGKRQRSEFLAEAAERELRRQRQLEALPAAAGARAPVYGGMMERDRPVTDVLLESLYYVPSDPQVARAAGLLRGEWRRKGVTLTLMDACLAALAMRRGLVLLSDNARHFPMKGLVVWTPHDAASKLP